MYTRSFFFFFREGGMLVTRTSARYPHLFSVSFLGVAFVFHHSRLCREGGAAEHIVISASLLFVSASL